MTKGKQRPSKNTEPGVYIIESLHIDDENDFMEGRMLSGILELAGLNNKYNYVRTERELAYFLDDFINSGFRFLHLSFHGNETSISTTLDEISHAGLGKLLEGKLIYRRLFMSACSSVNDSLAKNVMKISGCNSIIGPSEVVDMDEIAIFWASFYHLMFKKNSVAMKKKDIISTLDSLVKLYDLPIKYYKKSTRTPYYNEQKLTLESPLPMVTDYDQ